MKQVNFKAICNGHGWYSIYTDLSKDEIASVAGVSSVSQMGNASYWVWFDLRYDIDNTIERIETLSGRPAENKLNWLRQLITLLGFDDAKNED